VSDPSGHPHDGKIDYDGYVPTRSCHRRQGPIALHRGMTAHHWFGWWPVVGRVHDRRRHPLLALASGAAGSLTGEEGVSVSVWWSIRPR